MAEYHRLRLLNSPNDADAQWKQWEHEAERRAREQPCAPMPCMDHLGLSDFQSIYEPSDDSYLLMDAILYEFTHQQLPVPSSSLDDHVTHLTDTQSPPMYTVVEMGCGSGVVSAFFQQQWHKQQQQQQQHSNQIPMLCQIVTDINPLALRATLQTMAVNCTPPCSRDNHQTDDNQADATTTPTTTQRTNESSPPPCFVEAIQCDLASALQPHWHHRVHVLLFNPPYVPTDDAEVNRQGTIAAAWAGGARGRRVIDRALPAFCALLHRPHGKGYIITVDDNEPYDLAHQFRRLGLTMRPLLRRRAANEYLTVQKITWSETNI
jgi:release factor glutamine methyltransferase